MTTSVAVVGATGRLGALLCRVVDAAPEFDVVARLNSASSLDEALVAQVIIDATSPAVSPSVVALGISNDKKVLVATSGWSESRLASLKEPLADHPQAGVVVIPNFSLGSALASHLATLAARHFASVEIIETHGVGKIDSPSGTATNTAERIAQVQHEPRAPHADQPARGQLVAGIPVHSLRLEGVIARQDVVFGGLGETVTITHHTTSDASYEAGILASLRATETATGLTVGLERIVDLGA